MYASMCGWPAITAFLGATTVFAFALCRAALSAAARIRSELLFWADGMVFPLFLGDLGENPALPA
jgi:hypothetical protein